jgi:two-component system, chemotaxis family, sensor kinase CheA
MGAREQEFLRKLLDTFMVEAKEHIGAMSSGLVALEHASSAQEQEEIIESVFREAHSLKGAARAVNRLEIESICQSLENEFSKLKARGQAPSSEEFDRLHQRLDGLAGMVTEAGIPQDLPLHGLPSGPEGDLEISAGELIYHPTPSAEMWPAQHASRAQAVVSDEKFRIPDTVRVSTLTLDALLQKAEDLIAAKVASAYRIAEVRELSSTLLSWEGEWKKAQPQIRVLERFLDGQVNGREKPSLQFGKVLSLFLQSESTLQSLRTQLATVRKNLESDGRALDRKVTDVVADVKRISMLPFSAVLEAFPKLVRELCRDCGKNAQLLIKGGDIAADRRILEEIKDPLMHLVRNCIDHGIEDPGDRARKQKEARATIVIAVSAISGGRVEIVVTDDGAGVDAQKVRAAAIRLGLLGQANDREISDEGALSLIFQSGFSTKPTVTELSGRGLGLAIVREKVEKLGGSISLETELEVGTTFRLVVPLTMAAFRGILVRVGDHVFVLPSTHVLRVLRVARSGVKSVENRETFQLDGRAISLVRLSRILGIAEKTSSQANAAESMPAVLLTWAGERMVVLVDEVLKDQEILVKSLGKQLLRVRNIQGTTILGSGKVAAVLNAADLFGSAAGAEGSALPDEEKPKSILLAEDSITARTLLTSILESAGYRVKSAADGAQALAALEAEKFDLLVSDVDMPKLSGLDLTAKLRANQTFSELPVVLVTSLESDQDRERGLDVGANAYIVKSSFDQSNLLEVVRRLI